MTKIDLKKFTSVESSNIDSIYYEKGLYVKFKTSGLYFYKDVSQELYLDLMNAESKGKFFNTHIKPKFGFEKVQV